MPDDMKDRVRLAQVRLMGALAMLVTLGFFWVIWALMKMEMPPSNREVLLVMAGVLGTAWTGIMAFYFGSSAGSHLKDIPSPPPLTLPGGST